MAADVARHPARRRPYAFLLEQEERRATQRRPSAARQHASRVLHVALLVGAQQQLVLRLGLTLSARAPREWRVRAVSRAHARQQVAER